MKKFLLLLIISSLSVSNVEAQGLSNYDGGMKVKLNDDGSKYFRIISWVQGQAAYDFDAAENVNNTSFKLKRARVLMYSQITDKFLILTHFGMDNLTSNSMDPLGQQSSSQLFMHDAWAQYSITENHTVGTGLHYFNGISRLNNQSTTTLLTLSGNRQSWSTLGLSDQFARHLGVFAKGNFGKLQYRVAINDAVTNGLDARVDSLTNEAIYGGKRLLGSKDAGFNYAGYFEYNFLDQESNFLPFKSGTYLGTKRILNVGGGFFYHPSGSVIYDDVSEKGFVGQDVRIIAIDAFYEAPLLGNNDAITAYATFQSNDYGTNYMFSAYGTGNMVHSHLGYLFGGDVSKPRFQPFVSYTSNTYDAVSSNKNILGVGANMYLSGHNSKISIEYKKDTFGEISNNTLTIQAMVYL